MDVVCSVEIFLASIPSKCKNEVWNISLSFTTAWRVMTAPLLMGEYACSRSDLYQQAQQQEKNSAGNKCLFLRMPQPAGLPSSGNGACAQPQRNFYLHVLVFEWWIRTFQNLKYYIYLLLRNKKEEESCSLILCVWILLLTFLWCFIFSKFSATESRMSCLAWPKFTVQNKSWSSVRSFCIWVFHNGRSLSNWLLRGFYIHLANALVLL